MRFLLRLLLSTFLALVVGCESIDTVGVENVDNTQDAIGNQVPGLWGTKNGAPRVAAKMDVCHLNQQDGGTYIAINIAEPAFPAHLEHGDGEPGGPVPGMPGKFFGSDCSLVDEACLEQVTLGNCPSVCWTVQQLCGGPWIGIIADDTGVRLVSDDPDIFAKMDGNRCQFGIDGDILSLFDPSGCVSSLFQTAAVLGLPCTGNNCP